MTGRSALPRHDLPQQLCFTWHCSHIAWVLVQAHSVTDIIVALIALWLPNMHRLYLNTRLCISVKTKDCHTWLLGRFVKAYTHNMWVFSKSGVMSSRVVSCPVILCCMQSSLSNCDIVSISICVVQNPVITCCWTCALCQVSPKHTTCRHYGCSFYVSQC